MPATARYSRSAAVSSKPARKPYALLTVIMAAVIALGAVLDISKHPDALASLKHLGYPEYLVQYLGVLKLLGLAAVLAPGWPRLKEWAYAGLLFDTTGALYSALAHGDALDAWLPAALGALLILSSYFFHWRQVLPAKHTPAARRSLLRPACITHYYSKPDKAQ